MLCLHLLQRLELSPLILTDEIKVKRLVIVCQIGLRQMRETTGKGRHEEPIGTIFMGQTQRESHIDTGEPNIARKTIQDAPDLRLDTRQARQLPIHAIQDIGTHQKENAVNRMSQIRIVKHKASGRTHKDRDHRDHIRGYPRSAQQTCDLESNRTIENPIHNVFRLNRLQRCFIFLIQFTHYTFIYMHSRHLQRLSHH